MSDVTENIRKPTHWCMLKRGGTTIASELAGGLAGPGALYLAEGLAPDAMHGIKHWTAQHIVAPYFDTWNGLTQKFLPNFIANQDPNANREQKIQSFADGLVEGITMFTAGFGVRMGGQMWLDKATGIRNARNIDYWYARGADYGSQFVTIGALNTVLNKPTQQIQQDLANVLRKTLGMDGSTATNLAKYAINIQVPNMAGMVANTIALESLAHKYGLQPKTK